MPGISRRHTACDYIQAFNLQPHPEGGFYLETYRANEAISGRSLPERFSNDRVLSTAILYLLESGQVSRFHRIKADEIWHYHAGSPLLLHLLEDNGKYRSLRLGIDTTDDQFPQVTVPHGVWFGADLIEPDSFSLVGCTTAPGFEFADFELADYASLRRCFPQHESLIQRLTTSRKR